MSEAVNSFLVSWEIDVQEENVLTPQQAAAQVWSQNFERAHPTAEDACVFTVTDEDGVKTTVDLSDYDFEKLLKQN